MVGRRARVGVFLRSGACGCCPRRASCPWSTPAQRKAARSWAWREGPEGRRRRMTEPEWSSKAGSRSYRLTGDGRHSFQPQPPHDVAPFVGVAIRRQPAACRGHWPLPTAAGRGRPGTGGWGQLLGPRQAPRPQGSQGRPGCPQIPPCTRERRQLCAAADVSQSFDSLVALPELLAKCRHLGALLGLLQRRLLGLLHWSRSSPRFHRSSVQGTPPARRLPGAPSPWGLLGRAHNLCKQGGLELRGVLREAFPGAGGATVTAAA